MHSTQNVKILLSAVNLVPGLIVATVAPVYVLNIKLICSGQLPKIYTTTSILAPFVKLNEVGPDDEPFGNPKDIKLSFYLNAKTLSFHPSPFVSVTVK